MPATLQRASTSPSSTRVGSAHAVAASRRPLDAPVARLIFHACSGHTTDVAGDDAVGKRAALVRTAVVDRQEAIAEVEDRQISRVPISTAASFAQRDVVDARRRESTDVSLMSSPSSMGSSGMNCVGCPRRPAFQPRRRLARAFDLRRRSSSACADGVGRVDRVLADLLDAEALDEVVGALEVVGVLAVVLEEELARPRAPARWSRPWSAGRPCGRTCRPRRRRPPASRLPGR